MVEVTEGIRGKGNQAFRISRKRYCSQKPGNLARCGNRAVGNSLFSKRVTAAGIREIVLEFYPNGSSATQKPGFCGLYSSMRRLGVVEMTLAWPSSPQLGHATGQRARAENADVAVLPVIGLAALAAGPDLVLVDPYALSDPLLARLTPAQPGRFAPGHLAREIPAGYLKARDTGDTSDMDPALARYYEKLRLVVAGPLLSPARLRALIELQLGVYDEQLAAYETGIRERTD